MNYLICGFDKITEEQCSEFPVEISIDNLIIILGESLDYGCIELSEEQIKKLKKISPSLQFSIDQDYFIYS